MLTTAQNLINVENNAQIMEYGEMLHFNFKPQTRAIPTK